MGNPTRLEAGRGHVLAWCVDCPPWRRLAGDNPAALLVAADHLQLVHGDARAAARLRDRATTQARHAD